MELSVWPPWLWRAVSPNRYKILTWNFQDYHILHIVRTWQIFMKFWDRSCSSLKTFAPFGVEWPFCEIHRFQNLWRQHRHCYILEVTLLGILKTLFNCMILKNRNLEFSCRETYQWWSYWISTWSYYRYLLRCEHTAKYGALVTSKFKLLTFKIRNCFLQYGKPLKQCESIHFGKIITEIWIKWLYLHSNR